MFEQQENHRHDESRNDNLDLRLSISGIINDFNSGYCRYKRDEEKFRDVHGDRFLGSIQSKYDLTNEEAKDLFASPELAELRNAAFKPKKRRIILE